MDTPALTLFYDGNCPFCAAEMHRLKHWNTGGHLAFVDIAETDFDPAKLGATLEAMNLELHSQTADGEVLVGIDSMLAAYTLVGRGHLVAPLRFKLLRPALTSLYRKFARNRYRISAWLGYAPVCSINACRPGNPFVR